MESTVNADAAVIRKASASDAEAVASLNRFVHDAHLAAQPDVFHATDPEELTAWFRNLLEEPDSHAWLAEVDGQPQGYVTAKLVDRPRNALCAARRWFEIDNIAVNPACRRCGVGRALVDAVFSEAAAAGVTEFELTSWQFNASAHAFFERCGFSPKRICFLRRA